MRPRRCDSGSAAIEFLVIGIGALVPIVYLVQCLAALQTAALASTQAAREAARAFSSANTPAAGRQSAVAAARLAFADQGLQLPPTSLRITCVDGACLEPGSAVVVEVDWHAPLPWLPEVLASSASVPLFATQRVPIDELRSSPSDAA